MKTAAAYIRVSTDDQVEYSPESQLKKIREYAQSHDYALPDSYIYIDEGISGKNTKNRSQFNLMIRTAKCKPKPFDAILLWKFSRFARNREDSVVYKSMLRKQMGIDVISVSESLGDDKLSILIEALIEAMDEYYSINLAEEVKRGMAERASRGAAVTAPAFGYVMQDKRFIIQPEQAHAVRMVFEGFYSGKSLRELAALLNLLGFRTKQGNYWEARTIKYMLQNPVYNGKIRWNTSGCKAGGVKSDPAIFTAGEHEAIIGDALFQAVQQKFPLSGSNRSYHAKSPPYMLRGLVRCSSCGAILTVLSSGESLQCPRYAKGKCSVSHGVTIRKLNSFVMGALDAVFPPQEIRLEKPEVSFPPNLEDRIKKEETKLLRIMEAFENGDYTPEEFRCRKKAIEEQVGRLRQRFMGPEKIPRSTTLIFPSCLTDNNLSEHKKNALLSALIDHIDFDRERSSCDLFFRL